MIWYDNQVLIKIILMFKVMLFLDYYLCEDEIEMVDCVIVIVDGLVFDYLTFRRYDLI